MKNKSLIIIIFILLTIIIASIIYTTVPRLELNGAKITSISYREVYKDAGVILKNANSKNLKKVKIEDNIENGKIGTYYVDYSLKIGGKTLKVRRTVKIIDDISPIIKLNGEQIIEIKKGDEYKEPGYKAIDEYDGELTEKVEIIGKINTEKYGEQILKYRVKDNSNNIIEVNRIIKIIDKTPPEIVCESEYSAYEKDSKNMIGCRAIDDFDGDISNKIKISGNINPKEEGIYNIEYSVEDESGNKTKIKHKIIIFKKQDNKRAYMLINDTKELQEIINKNEIPLTIINKQELVKEKIEELKDKNIQIGLNFKNKEYKNIKEFKEYINNNKIENIQINKNTDIEYIISKLKNDRIILIYEKKESTEDIKTIIQILKQMNYTFDILNNY